MTNGANRLLAAGLCALIVVSLSSCGGSRSTDSKTTTSDASSASASTTVPAGPPPGAELIPMRDLDEGSCFDPQSDAKSMTRAVWLVNCDQPHSYEIYADLTFEGDKSGRGATYPGEPIVQDQAERRCYELFEAFVGVRWSISDLDIRTWWPSQTSWDNHDRKILCAVTPMDRSSLKGSQRSSKR